MPLRDHQRAAFAIIGGISLVALIYITHSKRKKRKAALKRAETETDNDSATMLIDTRDMASSINQSDTMPSFSANRRSSMNRGGRKNFRALNRNKPKSADPAATCETDSDYSYLRADRLIAEFSHGLNGSSTNGTDTSTDHSVVGEVNSDFVESAAETRQLEPTTSCLHNSEKFDNIKVDLNCSTIAHSVNYDDELCSASCATSLDRRLKNDGDKLNAQSPSLDCTSEASSQDSGKGASVAPTSSFSPFVENVDPPLVYEFEIPQSIVGLIIGRQGTTIKQFTEASGTQMIIRRHFADDNSKICTVEGRRDQINTCLRLIRRKFPPSRFPELKLTPLLPMPLVYPVAPIFDSIVRLNLPIGVKCEVVVSSLVEPDHFFVQQPTHPSFASLARLDQYMLAVYNQPAGIPGLPRPIGDGVICAAPVMDGWFRAQVIEHDEETDEVLLKFVDYGGFSKVAASDLRQIRSDFMTLPFQAIECALAGVIPKNVNGSWCRSAVSFFEQCVHGKIVDALVVDSKHDADIVTVELFYSSQPLTANEKPESISMSSALVENGFASWI